MRQGSSSPPSPPGAKPSGSVAPARGGQSTEAGKAARVSQSFALQQTLDSGDSELPRALPRAPQPGAALSAASDRAGGAAGGAAVAAPSEPDQGLDRTSDGSSGGHGDIGKSGTQNGVVSVGGDALIGTVLGERYRLELRVGEGGMGVVYQAEHLALKTKVAVKVLVRSAGEISRKRFLLEAQMASKVRHPNIVYLADYGLLPDGRPYLVMEFLRGPTLADALRNGRLPPLRACRIALQIARGMQTVHDQGIVHRDLKPSNIFLLQGDASIGQEDFVKIVDFGVAKDTSLAARSGNAAAEGEGPQSTEFPAPRDQSASLGSSLTRADAQIGTPQYMAPEQIDGGLVDARTDQYAFGCILYRMLTGVLPFMADTAEAVMRMHVESAPVSPRQRVADLSISDALEALVLRCLNKHGEDRFPSMSELGASLQQCINELEGRSLSMLIGSEQLASATDDGPAWLRRLRRPRAIIVAALCVGLTLGAVATLLLRRAPAVKETKAPRLAVSQILTLRQKAVLLLMGNLQATNPELRGSACSVLGRAGEVRAREQVTALLVDPVPEVRGQAVLALARLGEAATVTALRPYLEASQPSSVRVATAWALAELGDEQGSRFLRQALETSPGNSSGGADLRLRVALFLCERGDLRAVDLLSGWLERGLLPGTVQANALGCLAQASVAPASRQLVARMQSDGAMEERVAAAARLARARDPHALAFLRQLSSNPGPQQLLAARALAAPTERSVGAVLRGVFEDGTAAIPARVLAAEGIGLLGQVEDLRLLAKYLDAPSGENADPLLRSATAAAMLDVCQSDPALMSAQSLSWARSALSDKDWAVRSDALLVLADSEDSEDQQRVTGLLADTDVRVRRSVVRALGKRRAAGSVQSLQQALLDPDVTVRQEAWSSLGRLAKVLGKQEQAQVVQRARPLVDQAVSRGSIEEQILAHVALSNLGDGDGRTALRKLGDSADARTRELVGENARNDPELLHKLLGDRVYAVRFAAAQRLAEQGDKGAIPVLREGLAKNGKDGLHAYSLLRRLGQAVLPPQDPRLILSRGSVEDRIELVRSAAGLPMDAARDTLLAAARDRDIGVRRAVLETAESMLSGDGSAAALAALGVLTNDGNRSLRARAALLAASPTESPSRASAQPGTADPERPPSGASTDRAEQADAGIGTAVPDGGSDPAGGVRAESALDDRDEPPEPSGAADSAGRTETRTAQKKLQAAEGFLRSGIQAAERSDYKRAVKLLSRAAGSCSRSTGTASRGESCGRVVYEATYRMAAILKSQSRWADAANEYDKARQLQGRAGISTYSDEIARALAELKTRLGSVQILTEHKGRCRKRTQWLPPGRHMVKLGKETRLVVVSVGQHSEVGQCP